MDELWDIEFYETPNGEKSVETFFDSLEEKTQAKIDKTFAMLEEFGIKLGQPHVKKLTGTPLWELRIVGSDSIRIFYIAQTKKVFLILHAFKKKKMKTDKREIKTALARLAEFNSRGY